MDQSTPSQQPNSPSQSQPTPQQSQPLTSKPNLPPWASILIIGIIAVLIISLVSYVAYRTFTSQSTEEPDEVFCVADAKLCPDGSSVGRIPPACQFAECPKEKGPIDDDTSDWQIYRNEEYGFEMRYPEDFILYKGDHTDYPKGSFLKPHMSMGSSVGIDVTIALSQGIYSNIIQTAFISIAFDSAIANLSECQEFMIHEQLQKMSERQVINNTTFYKGITGGAAAGVNSETRAYHALHNDICYEVDLSLVASSIEDLLNNPDIEADKSEVWNKLENILSTFKFID